MTKTETPSSSGSAVLAGILVSGLLLAAGITIGYCKCLRKTDPKGAKLVSTFSVMSENTIYCGLQIYDFLAETLSHHEHVCCL